MWYLTVILYALNGQTQYLNQGQFVTATDCITEGEAITLKYAPVIKNNQSSTTPLALVELEYYCDR